MLRNHTSIIFNVFMGMFNVMLTVGKWSTLFFSTQIWQVFVFYPKKLNLKIYFPVAWEDQNETHILQSLRQFQRWTKVSQIKNVQYIIFEVLCMNVSLEKVDLECDNRLITNPLCCSSEYIVTQTPCTYLACYWITLVICYKSEKIWWIIMSTTRQTTV